MRRTIIAILALVIGVFTLFVPLCVVSSAEETVSSSDVPTSKVKVEWEVTNAEIIKTINRVWNSDTLSWDEVPTYTADKQGGAAFTVTNYGQTSVIASVTFTSAENMADLLDGDVEYQNNACTVLTPYDGNKTEYNESEFTALKQQIKATVKVKPAKFASLGETGTLGTYTVTVSEPVVLTFTNTVSTATISYNGMDYGKDESFNFTVPKNSVVSVVKDSTTYVSTLTVDGKTVIMTPEAGVFPPSFTIANGTVITESVAINVFACILSGSEITLADGSTKRIDDVTTEDKLMTFNFYEGRLDGNYPMYVAKHENVLSNVITVTLDNGTVLEMCDWQQFFDVDEKTYFDIDAYNYRNAVDKRIMFIENGVATSATIVQATMQVRTCTSFEIFTEYNKNFVANGILTLEPETYLPGVYTIGEDYKIDTERYQEDVFTYGRYTYDEFCTLMSEDEFIKMNIADKKIAVGKGIVSEEWLFDLYREWLPIYHQSIK